MTERLFLLDGTALAYRAYFAFIRARLSDVDGRPTGAVYGFVATLLKLIRDENPEHLGVAFDPPGPTFRHELYPEYKATRERMDDDLRAQMPVLREVVKAFDIPVLEVPGFEADDVLATVARRASRKGIDAYIVTGDKDLCQCVDEHVRIYNILKPGQATVILDGAGVEAEWGIPPTRITDMLALMGDASDNVPGVKGVGKKTALKLLQALGSLEAVLAAADADDATLIPAKGVRQKLRDDRANAELSYKLVTVDYEVPIDVAFEDLRLGESDQTELRALFKRLNFTRLLAEVSAGGANTEKHDYRIARSDAELATLAAELRAADLVAFDVETTGLDPLMADLVGVSFSTRAQTGWYVPLNVSDGGLFSQDSEAAKQTSRELLEHLRPVLENPSIPKCAQNAKFDILALRAAGINVQGLVHDSLIASFCLDPEQRQHSLDALSLRHFNYRKVPTSELIGTGRKQITMADVPIEKVASYAAEDADFALRLAELFMPRMAEASVGDLYNNVELPLVGVLAEMEWQGVRLDVAHLDAMSAELAVRAAELEQQVWDLAGETFNVGSPKQLSTILFEKLAIQGKRKVKKTKTGFSTDERTLRSFAEHEIVGKLLEFRGVSKLKSTYTDALPRLVNPRDGRVHTSYSQTGAVTGRLASSDPNLQNIPIRTEMGRRIRKAFVPRDEGWQILAADYSQIELRILAHVSGDENLCAAFMSGDDIHRQTAARVFGLAPEQVTPEIRSRAKAINFGIMYGMGANRLAEDTGMTRKEAVAFIENYFLAYPGVKAYLDGQKAKAQETGEVSTLLGRVRSVRDLYESSEPRVRAAADNVAVNTPIQGSAADIIKVAMLQLVAAMDERKLASVMTMQVHDELVFDVAPGELEELKALVKEKMEGAYAMRVPLVVDMGWGPDWLTAH